MESKQIYHSVLVRRLKERDITALDYLYDHYSASLYGIIHRTLRNSQIAEEVLHDVFLKIWNQIEKYDETKATLFTWMYRIARNQAIDARRSRDFKTSEKSDDVTLFVDMFETTTQQEDFIGIKEVIKKMGKLCRQLIQLNFFMGYSHSEISKNEGMALGSVKTKIRACLKELRKNMQGEIE